MMSIFVAGCGIKTTLNESELKWINVYKEGEVLIFKSNHGEFDTSIIVKKEIYYPKYNPVEVHGKYLPQHAVVWYKNKYLTFYPDGFKLVQLIKSRPKNNTFLSFNYLYASFLVSDIGTAKLEQYKNGKVYEFNTYHVRSKATQPKTIYWHEDYGIIKYITHAGEIWERINLPE